MNYVLFILAAVFVNNYILSQFLGICPFLGVSKKVETAAGMGVAVIFVMTLASAATYFIYNFILSVLNGFGGAVGFTVSIILMAGIRERVEQNDHPKAFEGFPFALVTAGLMSITFLGFQGLISVSEVVKAMGL